MMFSNSIRMLERTLTRLGNDILGTERELVEIRQKEAEYQAALDRMALVRADLVASLDLIKSNQGLLEKAGHVAPKDPAEGDFDSALDAALKDLMGPPPQAGPQLPLTATALEHQRRNMYQQMVEAKERQAYRDAKK